MSAWDLNTPAYLKGEGKNVYENEGDWIARILQTLEGFEDLFLESGLNHVHFDVNISGTFSGVIEWKKCI